MNRIRLLIALLVTLLPAIAYGGKDGFIEYRVPDSGLVVLLDGNYTFNSGGTVSLNHHLGTLYFGASDVAGQHEVPSKLSQFSRQMGKATNADEMMSAARWALKHGMTDKCYEAAEKALRMDSQNADAASVLALREQMQQIVASFGDSAKEKDELAKLVRKGGMRFEVSDHFVLYHDTPAQAQEPYSKNARKRLPRARERVELLEKVYETFLLKFFSQGVTLEIPPQRLKVVLFNDERDYQEFATSLSPSLSSAIGFFDPEVNISFFYDHGSSEDLRPLREIREILQRNADDLRKDRNAVGVRVGGSIMQKNEYIRYAETISLLVEIDHVNSDIEVVSHEATHQMAANTGLLPRHVMIPKWVHEGLATYFEAPNDATWSGMGAVNKQRLQRYNLLQDQPEFSKLTFVISDEIFSLAGSHSSILHGYGQGWALTHFLIEHHFEELMRYYRKLGEMPPDMVFTPELLTKVFDEAFDTDLQTLDTRWKSYMRGLKTDKEQYLGTGGTSFR